jgi:phenylpropionate dioxygenase-like ring-hydroxylating dioxygenase large terminal subunit
MDEALTTADARRPTETRYPREHWYAAVAASRLTDKPLAARVLEADIAVFRDEDGQPHALQDRCAHRGVALHLGEVKEGALACGYHGWRYGGDGACVHIPSLVAGAEIAKGIRVHGYPCAEADGYVWVWMGSGAPDGPPPAIEAFGRFNWMQGAIAMNCEALAVIENNIDWCHPVFAHPHTHGMFFLNQAMGFRDQTIELRRTERGLVVFQPATADADVPIPADAFVRLIYELPDRVTVAFNGGPQGETWIVLHMVPTGPASCRQEWLISIGPADGNPTLTWSDESQPILEQDRALMESAQRAFEAESHSFERSVEADAPTLLARRIYALACEGRWSDGAKRLPARRLLSVRT